MELNVIDLAPVVIAIACIQCYILSYIVTYTSHCTYANFSIFTFSCLSGCLIFMSRVVKAKASAYIRFYRGLQVKIINSRYTGTVIFSLSIYRRYINLCRFIMRIVGGNTEIAEIIACRNTRAKAFN